ncbi:MAG: DNA repair protein RadC [Firmicutes bacterium]|nr:DNA repair protein RadC [Bacillota bacterium]
MGDSASLKRLPPLERPREKLHARGVAALSDSELLAVCLHTGTSDESALALADRLLARFGGLRGLASVQPDELCAVRGVGPAKAARVAAALELGRRLAYQEAAQRVTLPTPEAVARFMMPEMRFLEKEHFRVILLDTKNQVIEVHLVSVGTLSSSLVHPRELFRQSIRRGCASVILVHNHPSGDPTPSPEDIQVTRRLQAAGELLGIDVLDHIIIGDNKYVSLRQQGLMG